MGKYELEYIKKSTRKGKKYMAKFYNKETGRYKTTHFGASGYASYNQHKDPERKKRYIQRHKKRENWKWKDGYIKGFKFTEVKNFKQI